MNRGSILPSLRMPAGEADGGGDDDNIPGADPRLQSLVNQMINKALARNNRDQNNQLKQLINEAVNPKQLAGQILNQLESMVPDEDGDEGYDGNGGDEDEDYSDIYIPSDREILAAQANGYDPYLEGEGEEQYEGDDGYPVDPRMNAELLQMRRQNDQLSAQVEELMKARENAEYAAELSDRTAQIQSVLNTYPFANDASRDVAFNFFASQVDRDDQGNLIANDLPLKEFVEQSMGQLNGLLASRNVGGAGATANGGRTTAPTMEQIRPGMSKEERSAVLTHAASLLQPQT